MPVRRRNRPLINNRRNGAENNITCLLIVCLLIFLFYDSPNIKELKEQTEKRNDDSFYNPGIKEQTEPEENEKQCIIREGTNTTTYHDVILTEEIKEGELVWKCDKVWKKHYLSDEDAVGTCNVQEERDGLFANSGGRCKANNWKEIKEGKLDWEHCETFSKEYVITDENKAKVDTIAEVYHAEVPQETKDESQLAFPAAVCKIKNWKELALPKGNMEH